MKIIVLKFGGTSVSTEERRNQVVNKIANSIKEGFFPVVVVSAMGRSGEPYATDTLINLLKSAGEKPSPRELDLLMSCGEIISGVILSNTLRSKGYESVALTGGQAGIITNENYGEATVNRIDTKNIYKYINQSIIPIIAGFQGVSEDKNITTLGRGGSDFTASLIGEALNAEAIEIYTDVEGIMTADPKLVENAKIIKTIPYNEIFQMAEYGAKVIHPRAVEAAMRSNIPLYIKNTLSDSVGTLITGYDKLKNIKEPSKDITAIINKGNKAFVRVSADTNENDYNLFDLIAEENISINMLNLNREDKSFIVEADCLDKLYEILEGRKYKYELIRDCSQITIIGDKVRGASTVIAKAVKVLSRNGIRLLLSSDSHTTVSFLIESDKEGPAVKLLHDEFELGAEA